MRMMRTDRCKLVLILARQAPYPLASYLYASATSVSKHTYERAGFVATFKTDFNPEAA
jgi:hypothetical protein